ncbi:MAG: oxidoreductase [Chitinophagaceae bacterium]|nr:MAG: oxidoreductase [Chitinophagaceae bacterium]
MLKHTFSFLTIILITLSIKAQEIEILTKGQPTSIRGLSVVNDNLLWVAGSKGTVGKSEDGGKTWEWMQVPGFEKKEFRDIEAFGSKTAVIMAITEPGEILKTTDGGKSWTTVFRDTTKGVFIDAFHFNRKGVGYTIGDPLDGTAYILKTTDNGNSWTREKNTPALDSGEACFASSGTNLFTKADGSYLFVTGGRNARFHTNSSATPLALLKGGESTGANSVAVLEKGKSASIVVVGGDFAKDTVATGNCVLIADGVSTFPVQGPHGYRSCVAFVSGNSLVACGTSGVDVSSDGGKNWKLVTKEGFHICQKAKNGKTVFLAGGNGKIARLK